MSIHLSIQADDEEVEGLLAYLKVLPLDVDDKIFLLERTLAWLHSANAKTYSLNSDSEELIHLGVDATSPTAVSLGRKHSPPRAGLPTCQEVGKSS